MPNSRFALHGKRPSLIHSLCTFFPSNSHGKKCAFFRLLLTPLSRQPLLRHPLSSRFALHGLHAFEKFASSHFSSQRMLWVGSPLREHIIYRRRGQSNIFPQAIKSHCSQTLHFVGKEGISREREVNFQGKITSEGGFPSEGIFGLFSLYKGKMTQFSLWAELRGGKTYRKANLARMARRKPFFEALRKLFLRWSAEGNSGHF